MRTVTSDVMLLNIDDTIICDASRRSITITIPATAGIDFIKKVSICRTEHSKYAVILQCEETTIEGNSEIVIAHDARCITLINILICWKIENSEYPIPSVFELKKQGFTVTPSRQDYYKNQHLIGM